MVVIDSAVKCRVSPHERYAMVSEKAYYLGEERRKRDEPADPAADWKMAEAVIDSEIEEPGVF